MPTPRLALIGCGAIAERFHAPAIKQDRALVQALIIADPDRRRTAALAQVCGGGREVADYHEVMSEIDGAIVSTPHHLHFPIVRDLLAAGVPVLCEKPLAGTADEARELVALAAARRVPLAMNNTRRLYPSHRHVAAMIADGSLGTLRRVSYHDGDKFDWPLASPSLFGVHGGGRGILLDIGAHVLDLVCWWLGARPEITRYEDDAMGGTEASAHVAMTHGAVTADVRLSWLGKLRNGFIVEGDRATVSGGTYEWGAVRVTAGGRTRTVKLRNPASNIEFASELLANFRDVIERGAAPAVSGADVLPSLELIDRCYSNRQRMDMPWFDAWQRVVAR